jgi:hypothetical protein
MVKDNWSSSSFEKTPSFQSASPTDKTINGANVGLGTHTNAFGSGFSSSAMLPSNTSGLSSSDSYNWGEYGSKDNFINMHIC